MKALGAGTAAVAWLLTFTPAGAVDLNAPISERPTVRSEILHGAHAAFDCLRAKGLDDALGFSACINDAALGAENNEADASMFKLGLYYAAWRLAVDAPGLSSVALEQRALFLPLQVKAGLTEAQLVAATEMKPAS